LRIVFIHSTFEFDGNALLERPLGGTETAMIGVTRELARIAGNEVVIFTNTPRHAVFDGVTYYPLAQLKAWGGTHAIDVLISIRQWMPFWLNLNARLRIYFSPDAYDQPFLRRAFDVTAPVDGKPVSLPVFAPSQFMAAVDRIFCVSRWQADTLVEKLGFPPQKIVVTGNAIFPESFQPKPFEERRPGLVYSSTPFRGLEHLAAYFPEIRRRVEAARLVVCSGMDVYSMAREEEEQLFGALYRNLVTLGAELHGSIRQRSLADIMCRNLVYAYPNTFPETFCISVLEAQAAGMAVVTSRRAALAERITHGVDGFLIDGEPASDAYRIAFIDTVEMLLTQPDVWRRVSEHAMATARRQTYDRLAASWQARFVEELAARRGVPRAPVVMPASVVVPLPNDPATEIPIDPQTLAHFLRLGFAPFGGR
jgi:glycosyltransferase involved in cell wall biosynthesis